MDDEEWNRYDVFGIAGFGSGSQALN